MYYLNDSGAMIKGWQKINGHWYYFNTRYDGGVEGMMAKDRRILLLLLSIKWSNGSKYSNKWI
ncbi:MAG: hypothetical protein E7208_07900 [Clostridium butyricum]|nr:hypothetical protein [Clostridium butyricum]